MASDPLRIFTVGHSTLGADAFLATLAAHRVEVIADGNNPSFRSYAAYTWSDEFAEGLLQLLAIASVAPTAIMCSELPWWRCHRALIADVLRFLGAEVLHIMGPGAPKPHPYTAPARVVAGELVYPLEPGGGGGCC